MTAPPSRRPTSGGYSTSSAYVEVNAPLLSNLPFVKMLTLDGTGRYDYNTTFGQATTFKIGLDYAINDDWRLRGGHSTGFRAPQLRELFSGAAQGQFGGNDPCATGGAFVGNAACMASLPAGITTDSLTQVSQVTADDRRQSEPASGNLAGMDHRRRRHAPLDPRPVGLDRLLHGPDPQRDRYAATPNQLLAACFGGVPYLVSQQVACQLVGPRTTDTGALGPIKAINANIGAENTDGIDIDLSYATTTEKLGSAGLGRPDLQRPGQLPAERQHLLRRHHGAAGRHLLRRQRRAALQGVGEPAVRPRQLVGQLDEPLLRRPEEPGPFRRLHSRSGRSESAPARRSAPATSRATRLPACSITTSAAAISSRTST